MTEMLWLISYTVRLQHQARLACQALYTFGSWDSCFNTHKSIHFKTSKQLFGKCLSTCSKVLSSNLVQIVAWAGKLADQASIPHQHTIEAKWRRKAADAVVMHCLHDLRVCFHICSALEANMLAFSPT